MIETTRSYCGPPPAADAWLNAWNGDPVLLGILALLAICAARLPHGRRRNGLGAVAMLALAFVSPLCALTTALFAARSVHHLVLVAGAAPLLALAWPARRGGIAPALVLMSVSLWLWHLPRLYDAALADVALYWGMQIALVASSWWFWSTVFRASMPLAAIGLTTASAQMGALGALLTFASRPLFAAHLATTTSYGIGPLADQQLAGLVMWVPGMLPFALAAGWIAARRWRGAPVAA